MKVDPQYWPVGKFFEYKPVYKVPAYQRSYAWGELEVGDFIRDLEDCYNKRKWTGPVNHFFGQVVTIRDRLPGTESQEQSELVDGQQRMATFILLVRAIISIYESIKVEISGEMERANENGILDQRIRDLTRRFIRFEQEIESTIEAVQVLHLSRRDADFFYDFLNSPTDAVPKEISHQRIRYAYEKIMEKVDSLTMSTTLVDRLGNLRATQLIIDEDFVLMNMVVFEVESRKETFKLFQVLNNRGRNLTEGDLLRAETLRLLSEFPTEQGKVEKYWDEILVDDPGDIEKFLKCTFGSYSGKPPGTNTLFIEFVDLFIPQHKLEVIYATNAQELCDNIKNLRDDILSIRQLHSGDWPYPVKQPVQRWDRNRFFLLMGPLQHSLCLPLLLSASLLDHRVFNRLVQMLERFVFRYIAIGKQPVGDLVKIYHEESKIIRANPEVYQLSQLRTRLLTLLERVDDDVFSIELRKLKYSRRNSNAIIKYLLLSLEYFGRWYKEGEVNEATCLDKERLYDFRDSTIEHIYPYSALEEQVDPSLEPLKNTLGNLTVLGHDDNNVLGNQSFQEKREVYEQSSLQMNREDIASIAEWTEEVVKERGELIVKISCAIFKI